MNANLRCVNPPTTLGEHDNHMLVEHSVRYLNAYLVEMVWRPGRPGHWGRHRQPVASLPTSDTAICSERVALLEKEIRALFGHRLDGKVLEFALEPMYGQAASA